MIILMGLAGSGKSTQGQILAEETGRVWLSAGQVLRDTKKYDEILNRGGLVDDAIVITLMADEMVKITQAGKDIVLDGFPRNLEQAEWVAENIAGMVELVVRIEVPRDELVRRLELRGRLDDNREAIEERFRITGQNIQEVCEILAAKGVKITEMSGVGNPEEVTERLRRVLRESGVGNE